MDDRKKLISLENRSGDPVTVGGVTVTPQSQALVIRLPFFRFVWNRPLAVLVERDGRAERIPVVDVTRLVLIGLGLGTVLVGGLHAILQGDSQNGR